MIRTKEEEKKNNKNKLKGNCVKSVRDAMHVNQVMSSIFPLLTQLNTRDTSVMPCM